MDDAFEVLARRIAARGGLPCVVHWADPLFSGLGLERRVVAGLAAECAARWVERSGAAGDVLVVDLASCGGSVGVVGAVRSCLPPGGRLDYIGFGIPERGGRGLVERGLAGVRCAFSEGRLFDVELPWSEVGSAWDWILVIGLDGRVGRGGRALLSARDASMLAFPHAAVVSFLDPAAILASLPAIANLAAAIGQGIEISLEAIVDGGAARVGSVVVPAGPGREDARRDLASLVDACSRFAHRAWMRPDGGLRDTGEIVEWVSTGLVEDHLLAGLPLVRVLPAGSIRAAVLRR